jgi:hypothetical protein
MDLRSERSGTRDAKDAAAEHERRLNQLIDRPPKSWRSTARWLRHPSQRWLRIIDRASDRERRSRPTALRLGSQSWHSDYSELPSPAHA